MNASRALALFVGAIFGIVLGCTVAATISLSTHKFARSPTTLDAKNAEVAPKVQLYTLTDAGSGQLEVQVWTDPITHCEYVTHSGVIVPRYDADSVHIRGCRKP